MRKVSKLVASLVASGALVLAASPAQAQGNANPGVLPAGSNAHGQSLGAWAADYWKWALETPASTNPLLDETGEFCGEGQGGSVWFIPGSFGGDAERSCSVPQGKTLFVPVFQWVFGASVYDCEPSVPEVECVVGELRAAAAFNTEAATVLEVTIDGEAVSDVAGYRAASPVFEVNLPADNFLGLPAGSYSPNVADGYWLMVAPLTPGEHTISAHVLAPDTVYGTIEFTATTHVTVE